MWKRQVDLILDTEYYESMTDFNELKKIINSSKMSVKKYQNGKTVVTDSSTFRGMPLSAIEEAQSLIESSLKEDTLQLAKKSGIKQVDTLKTVTERANRNIGLVMDCMKSDKSVSAKDMHRTAIRDSIMNGRWNISNGADPSLSNLSLPNIYISPWEANSLYSQKGLFETIINKKAKSILLNGLNIKNSKLSQKQLDIVNERAEIHNFKNILSDGTRDSLTYGGDLIFPMFKKDNPVTAGMNLNQLLKLGVLGKNCIDYFVSLDRWNTFIVPPFNPTQKDFMRPEVYTIPFLGADVYHGRCARIITAKQAGYWGQVINQGWGISDLCGYLQSGMNYKVAVQSLPLMIQQMSILARIINVDGILATEGANALDALTEQSTIRTREASVDNPVTMDVLGDIKSINRNFAQVPELIRLLRQDVSSDATIPEPMLFSSEKGNFSSGDDTQGNQSKQWEAVKMIHKEVEAQCKQLAKIMIIDALGTDKEIIEALPYTQIHFDEPVIANALERSQIGKNISENVFNLVSARIPIDIATEMAYENTSMDMKVSAELLEKLQNIQKEGDERDRERTELELEQLKANIENTKQNIENSKESLEIQKSEAKNDEKISGNADPKSAEKASEKNVKGKPQAELEREKAKAEGKQEKGYSRLEQKQHEKTRVGATKRSEKIAKAQNRAV